MIRLFRDRARWKAAAEADGRDVVLLAETDYPHPDDPSATLIASEVIHDPDPQLGDEVGHFDQGRGIGVLASTAKEHGRWANDADGVYASTPDHEVLCATCGGTILQPAVSGADRGTCSCALPGLVLGRRSFGPAGLSWTYYLDWNGRRVWQTFATQDAAREHLDRLRAGTITPEFSDA